MSQRFSPDQSGTSSWRGTKWTKCNPRQILFSAAATLLLASCSNSAEQAADPPAAAADQAADAVAGNWAAGRDRLCLANGRGGLITYAAQGGSNCMIRGSAVRSQGGFQLKPDGEEACTIDIRTDKSAVVLGQSNAACAYYCGPNASFADRRMEPTSLPPATDLAGDPLC
ncbi:hypothetical protein [Sphingomonas humi]|uniref:Lipoprotein n=1 Tax=Sphingomonas humi TaxID=335630 RepID=A0ABP7S716_9SPHN